MTPQQKMLVQCSFAILNAAPEKATALFYDRLFQLDPTLRPIFSGEGREDPMKMIGIAVGGLDEMDQFLPFVEDLGRRYSAYGIRDEHYRTVADALLWALGQALGDNFTPPVKEAWGEVYCRVASAMKRGAENAGVLAAAGV